MKYILLMFFVASFANCVAQGRTEYENKGLVFFLQNKLRFGIDSTDFIVYDTVVKKSLSKEYFLDNGQLQAHGIVTKDDYTYKDSILNSTRLDSYTLNVKKLTLPNQNSASKTSDNFYYLNIFKRFYYGGYVYVHLQVINTKLDLKKRVSALLKYDYRGNFIDSFFATSIR